MIPKSVCLLVTTAGVIRVVHGLSRAWCKSAITGCEHYSSKKPYEAGAVEIRVKFLQKQLTLIFEQMFILMYSTRVNQIRCLITFKLNSSLGTLQMAG